MPSQWTFRIGEQGLSELKAKLTALGPAGKKAMDEIGRAIPGMADGLSRADDRIGKTRAELEKLARQGTLTGRAIGATGQEVNAGLQAATSRLGAFGSVLGALGPAGLAVGAALGTAVGIVTKFYTASAEAEKITLRLDAVLKATGNTAGVTRKQIEDLGTRLAKGQFFDDEEIKAAAATLATFRSVSGAFFTETIERAADLSAVFGGDLQSATVQLGKALEDPVKGLTQLGRVGVSFSSVQKDLIKGFEDAGNRAEAQRVILEALTQQVGGASAAEGTGMAGAVHALSNAWNEFWEIAPEKLGPVKNILLGMARTIQDITDYINGPTPAAQYTDLQKQLSSKIADLDFLRSSNDSFGGVSKRDLIADREADIAALKAQMAALQGVMQSERDLEQTRATAAAAAAAENAAQVKRDADAEAAAEAAKKAAKEAAEAAKQLATQRAAASDSLDQHLAKLAAEKDAIQLTGREQAIQNALLEHEAQIKKGLIDVDDKRLQQIADTAGALADQKEELDEIRKGLEDEKKASDAADEKAKKDAADLAQKNAADAKRQADQQAEIMLEPWKHALGGIQDAFTDFFEHLYSGGVDSFKDLAKSALDIFKKLGAELTSLLVFRPIVGGVLNLAGLGGMADKLGLNGGSLGGGSISGGSLGIGSSGAGSQNSAASLGSGLLNFGGGGGLGALSNINFGSLFGGGGFASSLFGSPATLAAGGAGPSSVIPSTSGLLGSGGFLSSGAVAGGVTSILAGLPQLLDGNIAGGLITSGLSAAGFAIGGPIGGAIGGLIGNLVGGLFKKKPKKKNYKAVDGSYLSFDDAGVLGVDGSYGYGHRISGSAAEGAKLGDAVSDAFNDFMADTGAQFAPDLQGQVSEVLKYAKKGGKTKDAQHFFSGWFGGQYLGQAPTAEELIPLFLSGSLAVASQQGKVTGVSDTTQTIFKNLFAQNGNKGTTDAEQIQKALDFSKFYDRLDKLRTPADGAAEAIRELNKQMAAASSQAEEFGLDVKKIPEILKANFSDDIADQILALTDPTALAMKQLDIERAGAVAQAEKLGADLNQVEELYALKRQQIVEQGLQGVNSSFKQFFDSLIFGESSAVSPAEQLALAKTRYDSDVATGNKGDFIDAASSYLQLQRQFFASTAPYVDLFRDVLEKAKAFGGLDVQIPQFEKGGDHGGGLAYVHKNELIATGAARIFNATQTAQILSDARRPNNDNRVGMAMLVGQLRGGQAELVEEVRALRTQFGAIATATSMQNAYARYERNKQ